MAAYGRTSGRVVQRPLAHHRSRGVRSAAQAHDVALSGDEGAEASEPVVAPRNLIAPVPARTGATAVPRSVRIPTAPQPRCGPPTPANMASRDPDGVADACSVAGTAEDPSGLSEERRPVVAGHRRSSGPE